MTRYGILDDDGLVVRWVWDKPADCYQYIIQRVPPKPKLDLSQFQDAPF